MIGITYNIHFEMQVRTTMNKTELNLIEIMMRKTQSKQFYTRYQVIYLHLQGYKNVGIAKRLPLTAQTIGKHIRNYKKYGMNGPIPQPITGCSKKLCVEQEALFIETLTNQTPADVGLKPFMTWTCQLLCMWVKREFDISYSRMGMRDLLYCLGFSYTRPTYSLARASKEKQEAFKEQFETLKQLINGEFEYLLFQD